MPTYEYACRACANRLEVVQSFSDAALTVCESCGGELRKVFHPVGIAFKGSGFYKNDSRSKSDASSTKADAPKADATKGDSSSTKGDTPKATPGESKPAAAAKESKSSTPASSSSSSSSSAPAS